MTPIAAIPTKAPHSLVQAIESGKFRTFFPSLIKGMHLPREVRSRSTPGPSVNNGLRNAAQHSTYESPLAHDKESAHHHVYMYITKTPDARWPSPFPSSGTRPAYWLGTDVFFILPRSTNRNTEETMDLLSVIRREGRDCFLWGWICLR